MSSDTVISVENLSKSYLIGHDGPQERYYSLRDTLVRHGKNYVRKAIDMARGRQIIQGDEVEEFWALKDVSFEVKRGEVLGIIGRNGAGKYTLLKILSRITEPTSGRVTLNGRVASLLEVGTGFHPELTGRENIFLNGAILGMTKVEIRKKFDEIVDFAGVEKFLDTPVKRYSSGMYVRLAFAVAAHLEPEILIIDEVLAVGDAEFQKKCLGKMQEVAKGGRTVLFVSHNMAAVRELCSSGIVLSNGVVANRGLISETLEFYNSLARGNSQVRVPKSDSPTITKVVVDDSQLAIGNLHVEVEYESPWQLNPAKVGIVVYNSSGGPVLGFNTEMDPEFNSPSASGGIVGVKITDPPLHSGLYSLSVWLGDREQNYDIAKDIACFDFIAPTSLPAGISTIVVGDTRVIGKWSFRSN
jgi:lipopolysaccharide transport system ATP-binding protein